MSLETERAISEIRRERIVKLQVELDLMTARAEKAEAKLEVADAMLLEIWGAYNRIGDALKMPEKKASERGEAT